MQPLSNFSWQMTSSCSRNEHCLCLLAWIIDFKFWWTIWYDGSLHHKCCTVSSDWLKAKLDNIVETLIKDHSEESPPLF